MAADYVTVGEILSASGLRGDLRIRSFTRPDDEIFDLKGWMLGHGNIDQGRKGQGNKPDAPFAESSARRTLPGRDRLQRIADGQSPDGPFVLQAGRRQGKNLIAKLQGIDDRNAAEALTGALISIAAEAMPDPDPGQYYWDQLVGLRVRNLEDEDLGVVDHLVETGANDVLVVRLAATLERGSVEHLLPWIDSVVLEVNLEQGSIRVDWDTSF